jgi:hypothetical protein
VLFISSTSVYNDVDALCYWRNNCSATESGKQLLETEQLLQSNINFKRQRSLPGRENLENPNAPINLIHQEDCIGIINAILSQQVWGETFNVVTPYHPTRAEYYTQRLSNWIWLYRFTTDSNSNRKIILSDYLETVLKYTFTQPNL